MSKGRLEAFSDGVIAIIITIMVLELKAPETSQIAALWPLIPVFLSYVLSFIYVGIYWNNHHHLLQAVRHVDGQILWANLHLLFWLSLIPFATAWMGNSEFDPIPVAFYGLVLFLTSLAYMVLARLLAAHHEPESLVASTIGRDRKGTWSTVLYAAAIPMAFLHVLVSGGIYVAVAPMWLVPDARIERKLAREEKD